MFSVQMIKHVIPSSKYAFNLIPNKILLEFIYGSNSCAFCSANIQNILQSLKYKQDLSGPYPSAYEPKAVEEGWYEWWEQNGLFNPDSTVNLKKKDDDTPIYSLVLPPPNVTGSLHIGHSLTVTIQDCISRWHRMKGDKVHWIPGFDHGGIATQMIVEKKLWKERQLTRHDLGKEEFLKEMKLWKTMTQATIQSQLEKMGSSLDFSKTIFTLDENASKAVIKAFIHLFEENLIYRKEKLVNWSSEIQSVISDIEVEHVEIPGKTKVRVPGLSDPVEIGLMDYFYYPVVDSDEKILIATTRLETMLGDSAIAINPNDSRYSHLIGKFVKHPFKNEHLPIICDKSINKEFATGVMKVTPAHDFNDYELGEKHNLRFIDVFSDDGTVNCDIENFKDKHRLIVRKLLRESLSQKGLYKENRSHSMSIPFCNRTGDIVEPRLKEQWYLDTSLMGKKAVKAVNEGELQFYPDHHAKVWLEWFNHLKDWCISRQLWWGHPIPIYKVSYASDPQKYFWIAAFNKHEAIEKASQRQNIDPKDLIAIQDEDVLDTWFSSALFPLVALGWPSQDVNLSKLYPLSLMETGFDIIFFWVARMVMLGQHLTGQLPFKEVLLHGMVCDSQGRKMTKSLGNTIDPMDIIEGISFENLLERATENQRQGSLTLEELKTAIHGYKHNFPNGIPECGTDGLRLGLLSHDIQHHQINIDLKSLRSCRFFCNKIWQGIRLFTKAIDKVPKDDLKPLTTSEILTIEMNDVDRWILSRLAGLVVITNNSFEAYDFHLVVASLRQFWVQNFCDVYLEYIKPVLLSDDTNQQLLVCRVMLTCIEVFLRVISPMMPFLSEELYQRLTYFTSIEPYLSVSIAPYPVAEKYSSWRNTLLEADVHTVIDLVEIARSLKTKHGATKLRPNVTIAVEDQNTLLALSPFSSLIAILAKLESVTFHLTQGQEHFEHHLQDSWVFQVHDHGITVIMDIGEHLHSDKDDNKLNRIRQELSKLNKMVSDSGYRKKAPRSVQEKHLAKKASLEAELQKLLNQYGKNEFETKKEDSSFS